MDMDSGIPDQVVDLLNESFSGSDLFREGSWHMEPPQPSKTDSLDRRFAKALIIAVAGLVCFPIVFL